MINKFLNIIRTKLLKQDGQSKKNGSNRMMSFDMLYQLSYMSVIASAGVPRDQIFSRSAELTSSCWTETLAAEKPNETTTRHAEFA